MRACRLVRLSQAAGECRARASQLGGALAGARREVDAGRGWANYEFRNDCARILHVACITDFARCQERGAHACANFGRAVLFLPARVTGARCGPSREPLARARGEPCSPLTGRRAGLVTAMTMMG